MFCWCQLQGQHHRCFRLWVREKWGSVGNYRREMFRRWDEGHTYDELREFYRSERSSYENSKYNSCVFCRREPDDHSSYFCLKCRIKVGCRECCNIRYNQGDCCPLCDSPDW
uniref:RING-type domain-containing protein n=1 Tax=Panagrolaimus superbus TaxID=310955 RepID=A0A914Z415_9BILA